MVEVDYKIDGMRSVAQQQNGGEGYNKLVEETNLFSFQENTE